MRRQTVTKFFIGGMGLVLLLVTGVGIAISLSHSNLSANDTGALYGGQIETGYSSTGFMINFLEDGGAEFCGTIMLTANGGLTAAHCLDNPGDKYVGQGEFTTDKNKLIKVTRYVQKLGWDRRTSTNDLSVFELEGPLATVTGKLLPELTDDCNYRVVAYGRTEAEIQEMGSERLRKSAKVCLAAIDENIVRLTSSEGGICVGDSGSPVYREGTTSVAALISAVTKPNSNSPYCFVGNIALAVRVDSNREFVTANDEIDLPGTVFAVAASEATPTPSAAASVPVLPSATPVVATGGTANVAGTTGKIDGGLVLILLLNLLAVVAAGLWLYRTLSPRTATANSPAVTSKVLGKKTPAATPPAPTTPAASTEALPPLPDLPAPVTNPVAVSPVVTSVPTSTLPTPTMQSAPVVVPASAPIMPVTPVVAPASVVSAPAAMGTPATIPAPLPMPAAVATAAASTPVSPVTTN